MYYNGCKVIESFAMIDKKQNRIHKQKRINKKWLRRYGVTVTPKKEIFIMNNTITMHPSIASILKKEMEKNDEYYLKGAY